MGGVLTEHLDEHYTGREHSWIKHRFLTEYLKAAAFRTMQGRSPVFNYIDGFAGPWSVADQDTYSDSSFDHSIKALLDVKSALEAMQHKRFTVRFCLCERIPDRVKRLREYAGRQPNLDIRIFEGPFESRLSDIAAVCVNGFSFTFIDPTGFNLGSQEIANFLARLDGEFVLNFMSEHINRYPTVESVKTTFGRLLADTDWKARFDTLPSQLKNEERILIILKQQMKALGAARYMPDFEIMNARANRLQMRLVLGTNHTAGVEVFRDVQAKVEQQQDEIRQGIRHPGQAALFQLSVVDGIGSQAAMDAAQNSVVELLRSGPDSFQHLIGPVLEDAAIRRTHLKDLLLKLRQTGAVSFDLAGRRRKPDAGTVVRLSGPQAE